MAQDVINLQSTPDGASVGRANVSFERDGVTLRGTLFTPTGADGPFPGVIVTGAWTTVKEQMPGTYARALARRGFAALTFDFTGWGESGGTPRFVEDPETKTADIHAAVAFLASLDDVDAGRMSGLGVCASSGYMASAVADSDQLQKLALVAPWLHDPDLATTVYGGPESVGSLIALSDAVDAPESATVLTAASTTDESAPMFGAPYYTEEHRGLIAEYDNKFSVLTWRPWLTYDGLASADVLTKPTLMVGSDGMALPAGAAAYEERTGAPLRKVWFGDDVSQFDFYDRPAIVDAAVEAVAEHFAEAV